MRYLTAIIIIFISFDLQISYCQPPIAEYRADNNPINGDSGSNSSSIFTNTTGASRSFGISYASSSDNYYSAQNWSSSLTLNDFFQVTITPIPGYSVSLSQIRFNFVRDANGPSTIHVRYSTDGFNSYNTLYTDQAIGTANNSTGLSLTGQDELQDVTGTITFRVYGYSADNSSGVLSLEPYLSYSESILPNNQEAGFILNGFTEAISLPVELVSFTGEELEGSIKLNWETESETNNAGFEVQWKPENNQLNEEWKTLNFIEGNFNSNSLQEYSYTHASPSKRNNYYRLKQVDQDGGFQYSDIIKISIEDDTRFNFFPNPAYTEINITFDKYQGEGEVEIFDLLGNRILSQIFSNNPAVLNIENLTGGVYYLSWKNGINEEVRLLIKNH